MLKWISLICWWCCIVVSNTNQAENLNRTEIRFTWFPTPPYKMLEKLEDGSIKFYGTDYDLLEIITRPMNISYSIVLHKQEEVIAYGVLNSEIRNLLNFKVDVSTYGLEPTPERTAFMDLSYPIKMVTKRFLQPMPEEESRLMATTWPFAVHVWIAILASLISLVVAMSCFTTYQLRRKDRNRMGSLRSTLTTSVTISSEFVCAVFTNHSGSAPNTADHSYRMLKGTIFLVAFVLINSYTCNLISHLTVIKMKPAIKSFQDLAASQELSVIVEKDSVLHRTLMEAKSGPYKIIADTLRKNPANVFNTHAEAWKLIKTGRHAALAPELFLRGALPRLNKRAGRCVFGVSSPLESNQMLSLGFRKNSPYTSNTRKSIMLTWERGFVNLLANSFTSTRETYWCQIKSKQTARQRPLKLADLAGAFILLGIGLSSSFLVFLLELVAHGSPRLKSGPPSQ